MPTNDEQEKNLYLELSDTPVIRAAIQAIPQLGGSLDTLIFAKAQKIKEARFMTLIDELRKDLSKINEEMIDKKYLESEEFLSIVEKIFREVINEADEQKRIYLKNAIKSSSLVIFSEYDKETVLKTLQQVSSAHIHVLKLCIANSTKGNQKFSVFNLQKLLKLEEGTLLEAHLEYLVSVGLMYKEAEVEDASAEMGNETGNGRGGRHADVEVDLANVYGATKLGKQLIQLIEA